MKDWYRTVRFSCPTCGRRLAVEAAQVQRAEIVTCNRCNTDIWPRARGAPAVEPPARGAWLPDPPVIVEVSV